MSLDVARRRTKMKMKSGAPNSHEDSTIDTTTPPWSTTFGPLLAHSDIPSLLSCETPSRLVAEDQRKVPRREKFRVLRTESLWLGSSSRAIPARNAALTHLCTVPSSLFLLSVSLLRIPGLRHTQLCRALFLTLLRHDDAQTTTLIGAAQRVSASRERRNVSNPRPNRGSD